MYSKKSNKNSHISGPTLQLKPSVLNFCPLSKHFCEKTKTIQQNGDQNGDWRRKVQLRQVIKFVVECV